MDCSITVSQGKKQITMLVCMALLIFQPRGYGEGANVGPGGIIIILAPEKFIYSGGEIGEMILLTCSIVNTSSNEVFISKPHPKTGLKIYLTDKTGAAVPTGLPGVQDTSKLRLRPKDTMFYAINLVALNYGQEIGPIGRFLKVGTYKIRVVLDGVQSNECVFEVVSPGNAGVKFSRELVKIVYSRTSNWDYRTAAKQLGDLIHNPQFSPYAKNAYLELLTMLTYYDQSGRELQSACLEVIRAFPNSPMVAYAVSKYKLGIERQHGFRGELTASQKRVINQKLKKVRSELVGKEGVKFVDQLIKQGFVQ
jgi:hypothetical protein